MQENTVPTCYECQTTQNIKICSEYTAICQKCYDIQVEEGKHYKRMRAKDPQIDCLDFGIFLGNEDSATSELLLRQRDITAICVCGFNLETPFKGNSKYEYKILELDDFPSQPIKKYFEEFYQWMKKMQAQQRKILLHCAAGISRSGSFAVAYFMRERGIGFEAALQFVRSRRRCVHPNSGFREQLVEYQCELIEKKNIKL